MKNKTSGTQAQPRHDWTHRIANELRERGLRLKVTDMGSDDRIRAMGARNRYVSVDAEGWVAFWRDEKALKEVLICSFFLSHSPQQLDQQLRDIAGWLT